VNARLGLAAEPGPPAPWDALGDVPARVRRDLGIRRARRLRGGGTPALVLLCEDSRGDPVVVKVLHAAAGSVDGHDLGSFLRKPRQIAGIHRDLPGLSLYYVPLIGSWQEPGWGAYAMPWIDGVSPVTLLVSGKRDRRDFTRTVRAVFDVLGTHGYPASRVPAPGAHGRDTHLGRVRRRLPLLARHLDDSLTGTGMFRVNGREVLPAGELLAQAGKPRTLAALQPAALWYPVHGDLNLGNLIIGDGHPADGEPAFTVLDPRGITVHWDPVYDAAKALFSLTLFDAAMASGFVIKRESSRGYAVRLRTPVPELAEAAAQFPALLGSVGFFQDLDFSDPLWRRRLLYVHAFHVLAESACRLSDRTPRELPGACGWDARRELATGLYLCGLLLLNDLLAGAAEPENHVQEHLSCLAETVQLPGQAASSPLTTTRNRS
jgi:hypothetical protein